MCELNAIAMGKVDCAPNISCLRPAKGNLLDRLTNYRLHSGQVRSSPYDGREYSATIGFSDLRQKTVAHSKYSQYETIRQTLPTEAS